MTPPTVRLNGVADLNWFNVTSVAWHGARLEIGESALETVRQGRERFLSLIDAGAQCYGVTTGLGKLVSVELEDDARNQLAANILLGRASALGPPHSPQVARATLMLKLANFLSGRDGVTPEVCQYLVERLNDGLAPCIPRHGHGMGGDAVAHSHCFQTLIGEGTVIDSDGSSMPAHQWLETRGVKPYAPRDKEGISLVSGIAASVAYAMEVAMQVEAYADLALLTAACSLEAMAAPRDAYDPALLDLPQRPGTSRTIERLNAYLAGSEVTSDRLQAPVSYRIIPQVHGALVDAVDLFKTEIEFAMRAFTDNPVMVAGESGEGRLLSQGSFHDQHLLNSAELLVPALVHVGALGERRLHRLMDGAQTGLSPQLAHRPGLDAGYVTAHKACMEIMARAKAESAPLSLWTSETSGGQEDYMSLIFPVLDRIGSLLELLETALSYELLSACAAIDLRGMKPGDSVRQTLEIVREVVPSPGPDRSPGPDAEAIRDLIRSGRFDHLTTGA